MRVVLCVCLLLGGCSSSWSEHHEQGAFKLRHPTRWRISREGNAVVFRAPTGEHASFVVASVPRQEGGLARDLATVLGGLQAQHEALAGFRVVNAEERTLAGRRSPAASLAFQHNGITYHREQVVIERGSSLLVVHATAAADEFPSKVFATMFESLEVEG